MMIKSPIEYALRAWGRFYGERPPPEWDEFAEEIPIMRPGTHPLAQAMEFAGGDGTPSGRSARAMARIRRSPTWGFDPVVCTETRSHRTSTIDDIPLIVQKVQTAALELYRIDTLRGSILRFEYCKRGPQIEKAANLRQVGFPDIGIRVYRERLSSSIGWMECRLIVDI